MGRKRNIDVILDKLAQFDRLSEDGRTHARTVRNRGMGEVRVGGRLRFTFIDLPNVFMSVGARSICFYWKDFGVTHPVKTIPTKEMTDKDECRFVEYAEQAHNDLEETRSIRAKNGLL